MKNQVFCHLSCIAVNLFVHSISYSQCEPLFSLLAPNGTYQFGISVSAEGDINFDGYNDIIVGALGSGNAGDSDFVFVYSGADGGELYTFHHGELFEAFGWAVSTGDVNNDGYDDIIIGAPQAIINPDKVGRVYVFSGLNGDTLYTLHGTGNDDRFGYSVASGGDCNNDGYDEIVVGATYRYATGESESEVYVFSGQTGDTMYVFTSQSVDDLFGTSVYSKGDLNNDGFADLVIGAPYNDGTVENSGRVYAFSGQSGDTLFVFSGESENDFLGQSVAVADIDNDNYDDLIIGAGENISAGLCCGAGKVYVFSGLSGDTIHVINGKVQDIFGYRVAPAGDVDNDGFTDILVGVPFAYDQVTQIGRTYVYSGQTGELLLVFSGAKSTEWFGYAISSIGDPNNDGFDDIVIGARYGNFPASSGKVDVYSAISCTGNRGDVNGDGVDANVLDLNTLVSRIFRYAHMPPCYQESDVNGDGLSGNIVDLNYIVNRIFRGGPAPGPC